MFQMINTMVNGRRSGDFVLEIDNYKRDETRSIRKSEFVFDRDYNSENEKSQQIEDFNEERPAELKKQ